MPHTRTVKPALFTHEGLFTAEVNERLPLRIAFIALLTCCDSAGRFRWQPRRLKLAILPYDDVDMTQVLEALVRHGFVQKYAQGNETYGCIPSWSRHQKISGWETKSQLPPPETCIDVCATNQCVTVRGTTVPLVRLAETQAPSIMTSVQQVFEHWKRVMHHPNATLDRGRKGLISAALQWGYEVSQLCEAITGYSFTPPKIGCRHWIERYNSLSIILKDTEQIDRFIHHCQYPPHVTPEMHRENQAAAKALRRWFNKKREEAEEGPNSDMD